MYTIFGREFNAFRTIFQPRPADKEFAEKFYKLLSDVLLPGELIKLNRMVRIPGGLHGVEEGFRRMMKSRVNAKKSVYTFAETTKPYFQELPSRL